MDDPVAVAVRFGLYLILTAAFGVAAFSSMSLRRSRVLPSGTLLLGCGIVAAVLSVAGLLSLAGSMAGVPLGEVDRETVVLVLSGTAAGTAWAVRMAALAIGSISAAFAMKRSRAAEIVAAGAFAVALGTLAWTGHGAMDEGTARLLHLGSDIVHLLAAGIWVGALVSLTLLVTRPAAAVTREHLVLTHRALAGFSSTGTAVVAALVLTGAVNSWFLVGPHKVLVVSASLYGQLLVAKLVLFGVMLTLAASNRFRLVPAFEGAIGAGDHRRALGALRRSLALETACAVTILALVAWLGTLEPPVSG